MARLNDHLGPYGLTFPLYEALTLLFNSRRVRCRSARWGTGCRFAGPA